MRGDAGCADERRPLRGCHLRARSLAAATMVAALGACAEPQVAAERTPRTLGARRIEVENSRSGADGGGSEVPAAPRAGSSSIAARLSSGRVLEGAVVLSVFTGGGPEPAGRNIRNEVASGRYAGTAYVRVRAEGVPTLRLLTFGVSGPSSSEHRGGTDWTGGGEMGSVVDGVAQIEWRHGVAEWTIALRDGREVREFECVGLRSIRGYEVRVVDLETWDAYTADESGRFLVVRRAGSPRRIAVSVPSLGEARVIDIAESDVAESARDRTRVHLTDSSTPFFVRIQGVPEGTGGARAWMWDRELGVLIGAARETTGNGAWLSCAPGRDVTVVVQVDAPSGEVYSGRWEGEIGGSQGLVLSGNRASVRYVSDVRAAIVVPSLRNLRASAPEARWVVVPEGDAEAKQTVRALVERSVYVAPGIYRVTLDGVREERALGIDVVVMDGVAAHVLMGE